MLAHPPLRHEAGHAVFELLAPDELEDYALDAVLSAWLPLSAALNAVNRSMGRDDLYPFVLPPAVVEKLRLLHDLISSAGRSEERVSRE